MAVKYEDDLVSTFDDWYVGRSEGPKGHLEFRSVSPFGQSLLAKYRDFKREMDARCHDFDKLEMIADNEVISKKPDLPNVSSGETSGLIRRIARNLVQNTPNVEVVSKFDDDSVHGIFAKHILTTKIIGSDLYSNDMQQNLFASTKAGLTIGFDCVIPTLLQDAAGGWFMDYNPIHYRDVFPEPGTKDVRKAPEVFVRRYLTKGEVMSIIRTQEDGWDVAALRRLLADRPSPPPREAQSASREDAKRKLIASGYEIITYYTNGGDLFYTFCPNTGMLFRLERNKHPLKKHPVFFLVLEKDHQQPLGKSQAELVLGRQEFQDLMLNGAMKLWYRNINPSIIGYGAVGSIPNLSPGKYTQLSNPNARIEAFEVNTQTLMQYQTIAQGNLGSMVNNMGSADQQMATQAGNGMSATPQGVEAQQAMVDITTNNYQKAIESFFSEYCSYALTTYFQELKHVKNVVPNADARQKLIKAGLHPDENGENDPFNKDGSLNIDFSEMATEYFVRCIPGSLVELEDEKQLRILNALFVSLSQSMNALAMTQDQELLRNASTTLQYIIERIIELSGSDSSRDLKSLLKHGKTEQFRLYEERASAFEDSINGVVAQAADGLALTAAAMQQMQSQLKLMGESQRLMMQKLGVPMDESAVTGPDSKAVTEPRLQSAGTV